MKLLKPMEWVPIKSRLFASVRYAAERQELYLRFCNGDIYCYFRCSAELYNEFLAAESKGRYFSQKIRNQFRYEQVYDASSAEQPTLSLVRTAG